MTDNMSIMPGESIAGESLTLCGDASTMSRDHSLRRLTSPRRASSIYTTNSTASSTRRARLSMHLWSVKDVFLGSFALAPIIPRISAARREFATIRRGTSPAPLRKQQKILQDLLKLTRDEMSLQMRKTALKLLFYSFEYLVQQIFSDDVHTRKQFITALSELCDNELPYEIREVGLTAFYYIVGAAASLGRKMLNLVPQDLALEYEDCRVIQRHAQTTTQVSLKLCAYSYLILAHLSFANHPNQPVSEIERRVICIYLSQLTQYIIAYSPLHPAIEKNFYRTPFTLSSRRVALDLLWRFEGTLFSGLTDDERVDVWRSILSLSGFSDWTTQLQYHFYQTERIHQNNCVTRHDHALCECFSGLRYLWKFNLLPAWIEDMQELHESKKKIIGADLYEMAMTSDSVDIRRRSLFTIVLFANLPHWSDMYDVPTWRKVTEHFAEFCLSDTESVDRDRIMQRVQDIFQSMLEPSDKRIVTTRRELHITKHVSVVISRETDQLLALTDVVKKNCGPDMRPEVALLNLAVFTIPGESLLIHKDQQSILYERICSYTEYQQTRDIAMQAMFALLTIQEWISAVEEVESSY